MNQDTTMIHDDQLAIVLGQRQLVAVCCMFLVVIGLVSTLSYVAGRSITAAQARSAELPSPAAPLIVDPTRKQSTVGTTVSTVAATAQPVEAHGTPEPVAKPSPFSDPTPVPVAAAAAVEAEPAAVPVAQAAAPAPSSSGVAPAISEPSAGQSFYQVGSIEPAMAAVFSSYLTQQGFRVRLAPGANGSVVRVLVGPLASERETETTRVALEAAGFEHFLKKY